MSLSDLRGANEIRKGDRRIWVSKMRKGRRMEGRWGRRRRHGTGRTNWIVDSIATATAQNNELTGPGLED